MLKTSKRVWNLLGRNLPGQFSVRPVSWQFPWRTGSISFWLLPLVAILGLTGYLWLAPAPRRPISASETSHLSESVSADHDADVSITIPETQQGSSHGLEQRLEGHWIGYYQGQRQLSVRSDGTCTMTAEPEGLAATLLAPKLTFEIRWKVRNDIMEFETVSGEPLNKVNLVLRMYGAKRSHKILKLEPAEMVLLDEDGVTKYEWRRVEINSP